MTQIWMQGEPGGLHHCEPRDGTHPVLPPVQRPVLLLPHWWPMSWCLILLTHKGESYFLKTFTLSSIVRKITSIPVMRVKEMFVFLGGRCKPGFPWRSCWHPFPCCRHCRVLPGNLRLHFSYAITSSSKNNDQFCFSALLKVLPHSSTGLINSLLKVHRDKTGPTQSFEASQLEQYPFPCWD